ncbi:DUF7507 domain-containing protein [Humidisolicoccus flavus]|uniref:DUF7507 domain-containing protein n=1 Tax=Humidisolicoccus flavus TaxID=3111414 RepID=UPI00324ABA2B
MDASTTPARRQRTLRGALALVLATLMAVALLPLTTTPASAAPGDYTVEIVGPDSIPIYDLFTYTATVSVEASADQPANGIVLTSVLAEGVQFESVPTGGGSPVASASYDAATRTVTFVMKELTEQLSSFTFAVRQVDNTVKTQDTVYNTSLTGTATPSGVVPSDTALTQVTGNNDYNPSKSFTTVQGSGNRLVTYYFNVNTTDASSGTEAFTSWSQRLVDTLPAGAVVTGTSTWSGGWALTGNPDGTTTAVWERDGSYGPSGGGLDGSQRIWITVEYPVESFPTGTRPPANVVELTSTDHAGNSFGPWSASVQGPELQDGSGKGISISKFASTNEVNSVTLGSGAWFPTHLIAASYLNTVDSENLESLTVEDSAAQSPENAAFFEYNDIYRLSVRFNPTLQNAALPYNIEYTTSGSTAWQSYDTTGLTTADTLNITTATAGSNGMGEGVYIDGIVVPVGERLTGWRVVVSPDAATSVGTGAEVRVLVGHIPSFRSLAGGSDVSGELTNTATASGATPTAETFTVDDEAFFTIVDRVPIITSVFAPSTLSVGSSANFVATITNLDPSGLSYENSVMKVVLPVGVAYDASTGVSPTWATTPVTGIPVPTEGNGVTVTTETITDEAGEHQVVVFTFDELPSTRTVGQPKTIDHNGGFRYNIPTTVLPQAFDSSNTSTLIESWAYTNDAEFSSIPMAWYGPYYAPDRFDFNPALSSIALAQARPVVTTAGGLLLGKQVRVGDGAWSTDAIVTSPGQADWQIYVANVLPQTVTDIVVFDLLPAVGDARGSEFAATLSGEVTGLPEGAVVEYSNDATSATTGTWTSEFEGATAFRVIIPALANGENFTLIAPTAIAAGARVNQNAVNDVTATGFYQGSTRNFASNDARITPAQAPSLSIEKSTNGAQYEAAPGAIVATGSEVTWTYLVTNTGNTTLNEVAVADVFTAGDGSTGSFNASSDESGALEPGESRVFTATGTAVAGQYENTATATAVAVDDENEPLAAQPEPVSDSSWYLAGLAGVSVTKQTNGQDVDAAPGLPLVPGAEVEWTYVVTNTGSLDLSDVLVVDVDSNGTEVFRDTIAALPVGESVTLSAEGIVIEGQYENTVTVTAEDPSGETPGLTDADSSWYFGVVSSIDIEKEVSPNERGPFAETTEVSRGSAVWWQFIVTNTGNAPLTDVAISDPSLGSPISVGNLAAGASVTIVIEQSNVTVAYTNTATASGNDPNGTAVNDSDDASVTITDDTPTETPEPSDPGPSTPGSSTPPPTAPTPTAPAPTAPAPSATDAGTGSLPVTGSNPSVLFMLLAFALLGLGAFTALTTHTIRKREQQ